MVQQPLPARRAVNSTPVRGFKYLNLAQRGISDPVLKSHLGLKGFR